MNFLKSIDGQYLNKRAWLAKIDLKILNIQGIIRLTCANLLKILPLFLLVSSSLIYCTIVNLDIMFLRHRKNSF